MQSLPTTTGERSLDDRRRSRLALIALLVLAAIPLVVAVVALREPRWYPSVDDAQTELRVRDVWTAHPPLTGLGGRIGEFGPDQGSHPGPLSFWSLSVVYRLFGASSAALRAAAASLNILALGLSLWLARRRGGLGVLLATAAVLALLANAYGAFALTLPWNPYMPMLWWPVVLLGVWSLLSGDLPVLPVTVFAASFCMQTHVSYAALVSALAVLGVGTVGYWLHRRRHDRPELRRSVMWTVVGGATGAVLWFPAVAEQTTGSQGHNLAELLEHFTGTPEEPLGLRDGLDAVVANLNLWRMLTEPLIEGRPFLGGSMVPGALLLAAWMAAVVVSWRLRHLALMRLHLLLAIALPVAIASASRIIGAPFAYLALWTWGICALMVLAIGWSACAAAARIAPAGLRPRLSTAGAVAAIAVVMVVTISFTLDAATVEERQPELSVASAQLVPETIAALDHDPASGNGRDGHYLVTWVDPPYLGGRGFVLFNELDRAGFDVGATEKFGVAVTRHRVIAPEEATAEIHLATGPDIETWKAKPGYEQIAFYDPPEEGGEFARLRAEIVDGLREEGRDDLVTGFEEDPHGVLDAEGLPVGLQERLARWTQLGAPVAVLLGPPSTRD